MNPASFTGKLQNLLTLGNCSETDSDNWASYREVGTTSEDIPEWIRRARDEELDPEDAESLGFWTPVRAARRAQLRAEEGYGTGSGRKC